MSDLEKLRHSFRPKHITTLFVGESPPHSGKFFYKEDSQLYHRMREAFGAGANFLLEFKAKGLFLDDLLLYPINQIKNKNERDEHRQKGVPSLARRMADYRPLAVVAVMCAIKPMVEDAMRDAGLSHVPLHVVPFPLRPEQQERFKAEMAEIIPKLPPPTEPSQLLPKLGARKMAMTTAEEMAKQAGVNPKTFRQALREEGFHWHGHYDRWTVAIGSEQHKEMERVLRKLDP